MALVSGKPLSGKVAIVTGGASGIGLAIVQLFLESGAQVAVLDIQSNDELSGSECVLFVKANIASEESVKNAMTEILSKWGRLDVLVNNAGIMDDMCMSISIE
jgi:NAD(P)-dependent dehydrogenase (short-subunit alcohol dehydrogenase family)